MGWHLAVLGCLHLRYRHLIWEFDGVPVAPLEIQFLLTCWAKQREMAQALVSLSHTWETEKAPTSWLWIGLPLL